MGPFGGFTSLSFSDSVSEMLFFSVFSFRHSQTGIRTHHFTDKDSFYNIWPIPGIFLIYISIFLGTLVDFNCKILQWLKMVENREKEGYTPFYFTLLKKPDTQWEKINCNFEPQKAEIHPGIWTRPAWTECRHSTTCATTKSLVPVIFHLPSWTYGSTNIYVRSDWVLVSYW